MDLTINEKRVLAALIGSGPTNAEALAEKMDAALESVIQWAHLCADKGLVTLEKTVTEQAKLTEEGEKYAKEGLPERQILAGINGSVPMSELTKDPLSRIAIGWLRKKNWVTIKDGIVFVNENTAVGEDELALKNPVPGTPACKELVKRGLAEIVENTEWKIALTPEGEQIAKGGLDLREEVATLSREQILSGEWKSLPLRKYSIAKLPKKIFGGRIHPNQQILDEIRDLLFEMGFTEFHGSIVQNSFWNF
ncbi:MAG: phenylalanine--tRNA ligase subunit alpha, partial [Methanocorpusculum sp.]|nr:phenylalanine--tRNA ligase subunit alpha [Methanocorpusculum sp.]